VNSIFTDLYNCVPINELVTKAQADTDPNETLGYDFFPARAGHLET